MKWSIKGNTLLDFNVTVQIGETFGKHHLVHELQEK